MKDLVAIIQSRSRVGSLDYVIQMLYNNCTSRDNFDIVCLVDDDQIGMYQPLISAHPEIIWIHPPHTPGSWYNLVKAQYDFISTHDYYFNWILIDDFVGLQPGWDQAIVNKKHAFADGIFTMHQAKDSCHGRFQWIFDLCYVLDNMDIPTSLMAHCEMLPIHTKRWVELMHPIFNEGNYTSQQELITSAIVALLKNDHNIKRMIRCEGLEWQDGFDGFGSQAIVNKDGLGRTESFFKLAQLGFPDLQPIIQNILAEIK